MDLKKESAWVRVFWQDTQIQPITGSCMEARPKGHLARVLKSCEGKGSVMEDKALQEISLNLIPDDIPCASVSNSEDVGKWTIPQLKC